MRIVVLVVSALIVRVCGREVDLTDVEIIRKVNFENASTFDKKFNLLIKLTTAMCRWTNGMRSNQFMLKSN